MDEIKVRKLYVVIPEPLFGKIVNRELLKNIDQVVTELLYGYIKDLDNESHR